MTKHTVITLLGILVVVVGVGGFPPGFVRTSLLVLSGTAISVLSYLSSVVYCSNCKKLIEDAEQALPSVPQDNVVTPQRIQ